MTDKVRDQHEIDVIVDNKTASNEAEKKPKYPKIVILFLVFIIFEVFSGGGFRTVLMIYMKNFIKFSDTTATAIYHTYATFSSFTPIIGAIIADAYLGPYKTIKYSLMIVIAADILLTITSIQKLGGSHSIGLGIALLMKSIASGGLGPCLGTLGANQFRADQKKYLERYFSVFYLSINIASSVSSIVLPMLRNDVKCYDQDCYPLAYGTATVVLIISFVIFLIGSPYYRKNLDDNDDGKKSKKNNVITQTISCVYSALKNKFKSKEKQQHWLDYADEKFSKELISDVKILMRVIIVFLPLPIFWGLYEQQYSRWILQAQQLNGIIGSFTIKPDQLQSVNPILIVILVPCFDFVIYPLFSRVGLLKRQLQRISLGLIFAILSFGVATVLEWQMQAKTLEYNPINQIKILNLSPCGLELQTFNYTIDLKRSTLLNNNPYSLAVNPANNKTIFDLKSTCKHNMTLTVQNTDMPQVLIFYLNQLNELKYLIYSYDLKNQKVGFSELQILALNTRADHLNPLLQNKIQIYSNKDLKLNSILNTSNSNYSIIDYSKYDFKILNETTNEVLLNRNILFETCSRYTIILFETVNKTLDYVLLTDIHSNGLHISLQLVQIFLMGIAEILVSISGLTFSYEEAPRSMKSLLQALWILTTSVGNLIVVIIAQSKFVSNQVFEYIIFISLLAVATSLFFILAFFYKYADKSDNKTEPTFASDLEKDMLSKEIEAM